MRTAPVGARDARRRRWLPYVAVAIAAACVALLSSAVLYWTSDPGRVETRTVEPLRSAPKTDSVPPVSTQRQGLAPAPLAPRQPVPRSDPWPWHPPPAVIAALEAQGIHRELAEQVEVERVALAPETTGYLGNTWNWLPELTKASSTLVLNGEDRPSMLQLHDISESSILNEIGLVNGDVLVLLDEQILEFGRRDLFDHSRRMRAALESLERGEPVSVTLLRDGRPRHLVYQRW